MALIIPRKGAGMKPWALVRTKIKATNSEDITQAKTFKIKWGNIPQQITPSARFRVLAQSDNCAIKTPWGGMARPNPLLSAGIGGFGLLGAGLAIGLQNEYNNLPQVIQYGLGGLKQEFPPTFGYCIDDIYSERTYIAFKGINNDFTGDAIITSQNIDVRQKYTFVRFYLHHGEIAGYTKNASGIGANEEVLSFGINKTLDEEFLNNSFGITIYKKDGRVIKKTIKRFLPNFNAVVDKFEEVAPEPGDFYEFDKKITIEDPYLMAGIYLGREDHYKKENISTYNFPESNNQKHYQYTRFVGGYYLKNQATQEVLRFSSGASFNDETENKWHWFKFDEIRSSVYLDEIDRFSQKRVEDIYEKKKPEGAQEDPDKSTSEENETASSDTIVHAYDYFWRLKGNEDELNVHTDFMRLEIAHAGDTIRNNFHYPMLKNSFIKQNNNYFKILAQLDSVTVDVSLKSVDGGATLDVHADIEIIQQYGWKINEHYSNILYLFGDGAIKTIAEKMITLSCDASHLSIGTVADLNGKLSKRIDYMEANSFFYRFLNKLDEPNSFYIKGNNWKLHVNNRIFTVKKLIASERISETKYEIVLELSETNSSAFKVSDLCDLYFDFPHPKATQYNGNAFLNVTSLGASVCVEEEIFSPYVDKPLSSNSILGICDDYLIGVGLAGDMTPIFWVQVPEGFLSISSVYSKLPYIDGVLYRDQLTRKATLRTGTIDFTERPSKLEITMATKHEEDLQREMNQEYDKLHSVRIELPEEKSAPTYLTFASEIETKLTGFQVSGNGKILLGAFNRDSQIVQHSDLSPSGLNVSPIYIYKKGAYNKNNIDYINVGIPTSYGSFYVNEGLNSPIEVKGKFYYTYDNQSIESLGACDIHIAKDGEYLMVYGSRIIHPFKIGDIENKKNKKPWKYSDSVVMITGSYDSGLNWGTPNKKESHLKTKWGLPIMLAHSCEYLCSYFDKKTYSLGIFTNNYDERGVQYIGYAQYSVSQLTSNLTFSQDKRLNLQEDNFEIKSTKGYILPFWTAKFNYESSNDWGTPPNIASFNSLEFPKNEDTVESIMFKRVIGPKVTKSFGEANPDFGLPTCYQFTNGLIILLFDTPFGVQFAYSNSGGTGWNKSDIVLARNATCGFIIDGDWLYYLSPSGLALKQISETVFEQAINVGKDKTNIEKLQKEIDNITVKVIGGGNISQQRFSGYTTAQGISKVFFYDSSFNLACLQTKDGVFWETAPNF